MTRPRSAGDGGHVDNMGRVVVETSDGVSGSPSTPSSVMP